MPESVPAILAELVTPEAHFSGWAYCFVHSFAVSMAAFSSSFQLFATSAARGSSGLGAPRSAWIESRIVLICRAGDQLSTRNRPRQHAHSTFLYVPGTR